MHIESHKGGFSALFLLPPWLFEGVRGQVLTLICSAGWLRVVLVMSQFLLFDSLAQCLYKMIFFKWLIERVAFVRFKCCFYSDENFK